MATVQKSNAASNRIPLVIGNSPRGGRGNGNNGNFIHGAAARRLLQCYADFHVQHIWTEAELERIRSDYSHVIFIAANGMRLGESSANSQIRELARNQANVAENIERAGLPVVVLGLGAQANLNGAPDFTVIEETRRLLHVLSYHSQKVAVRGAFTAEACLKLGVNNVEVIGCQSLFWHLTPHFTRHLTDPTAEPTKKIAFNYTYAQHEAELINQAMSRGHDVIGQGNVAEEDIKNNAKEKAPFGWGLPAAFERGLIDKERYEDWIRGHFVQFHDAETWIDEMKHYRFSYGTRFHGNMAALISGVRALWIVHDMRTKEMCEHFKLPFAELKTVKEGVDLYNLFESADYLDCINIYPDRYRTLFDYLEGAGVPHSLPLPHGVRRAASKGPAALESISWSCRRTASSNAIEEIAQKATNTNYDRYPQIFKLASTAMIERRRSGRGTNILSFGCARGEEALALAEKYFTDPRDQILGVDISPEQLELARAANRLPARISFELSGSSTMEARAPFDAIFAMSVLCSWPGTQNAEDASSIFSFKRFSDLVAELDRYLAVGGVLVIYNANFRFCDTVTAGKYRVIPTGLNSNGFVYKFDATNRRRIDYDSYDEIIFEKLR